MSETVIEVEVLETAVAVQVAEVAVDVSIAEAVVEVSQQEVVIEVLLAGPAGADGSSTLTLTAAQALGGHRLVYASAPGQCDYVSNTIFGQRFALLGLTRGGGRRREYRCPTTWARHREFMGMDGWPSLPRDQRFAYADAASDPGRV